MKTLYKTGYLIRVTSWENDGDNYNTLEIQVDTEQEARDTVAFCKLFSSPSCGKDNIGNLCDGEYEPARPVFRNFYLTHPGFAEADLTGCKTEEEETDIICDVLIEVAYDLGLSGSEYFYTRVCGKVEVYYIPADVVVEQVNFG